MDGSVTRPLLSAPPPAPLAHTLSDSWHDRLDALGRLHSQADESAVDSARTPPTHSSKTEPLPGADSQASQASVERDFDCAGTGDSGGGGSDMPTQHMFEHPLDAVLDLGGAAQVRFQSFSYAHWLPWAVPAAVTCALASKTMLLTPCAFAVCRTYNAIAACIHC